MGDSAVVVSGQLKAEFGGKRALPMRRSWGFRVNSAINGASVIEFKGELVVILGTNGQACFKSSNGSTWNIVTNLTDAHTTADTYIQSPFATVDSLFYYKDSGNGMAFVNNLTSSVARTTTASVGNATFAGHDTINNRLVVLRADNFTDVTRVVLPYLATENKVFMPVQNTLVRVY